MRRRSRGAPKPRRASLAQRHRQPEHGALVVGLTKLGLQLLRQRVYQPETESFASRLFEIRGQSYPTVSNREDGPVILTGKFNVDIALAVFRVGMLGRVRDEFVDDQPDEDRPLRTEPNVRPRPEIDGRALDRVLDVCNDVCR